MLSHIRMDDKTRREEDRLHDKFAPARYIHIFLYKYFSLSDTYVGFPNQDQNGFSVLAKLV